MFEPPSEHEVFVLDGVEHTLEDLTLDDLTLLFQRQGSWRSVWDQRRDTVVALLSQRMPRGEAERRVGAMTLREFKKVCRMAPEADDHPAMYQDGLPLEGGRLFDFYVARFALQPWYWPPQLTRSQRLRDLKVILEAYDSMLEDRDDF